MRYILPSRPSLTSRALPKLGRLGNERAEPDISLARARAWESQLGMTRTRAELYRAEPARLALPSLVIDERLCNVKFVKKGVGTWGFRVRDGLEIQKGEEIFRPF